MPLLDVLEDDDDDVAPDEVPAPPRTGSSVAPPHAITTAVTTVPAMTSEDFMSSEPLLLHAATAMPPSMSLRMRRNPVRVARRVPPTCPPLRNRCRVVAHVASVIAALAGTLLGDEEDARAQNVDPFFFGDEAALASGSVVASGRDSGALWYNPAGFGGLQKASVSASASTFGLRFRTIPRALRVIAGGQERAVDLSSTDVISVPNAIVLATKVGDRYALAGGLLVTNRDVRSALATEPEGPATDATGPLTIGQRLDLQADAAKYHLGGAFAAALTSQLRAGGALFMTYTKSNTNVGYSLNAFRGPNPTDERAFILQTSRITASAIGVAASVGAQFEVSPLVTVGATIRTPEIALSASAEGGAVLGQAQTGGTEPPVALLTTQSPFGVDAAGKLVSPARVLLGVAFALGPPQSWIEVGVDAAHGLPASDLREAQQPQVNGRVGARYMLSSSWIVGGGLFSDRTVASSLSPFIASDRVDYYGLTAGVSKRTPLGLVKDPNPEALVLVTTLSLRSAVGFGEARALTINLDTPDAGNDARSDVTFFEVMPYLGSSVVF